MTAVGYPELDSAPFQTFWPADLHVIGKDIVRFHAIYWPAFLMSAGIAPPKRVFGHGFLNIEGQKMSKSLGNVITPKAMIDEFGLDQMRYFLMREVPYGNDGSFTKESLVNRINADLANDLGNLAQRVLTLIHRNCEASAPQPGELGEADIALQQAAGKRTHKHARGAMELQAIHRMLEAVWAVVGEANRYVDAQAPWALRENDPARMNTVLYVLADVIRILGLYAPVDRSRRRGAASRSAVGSQRRAFVRAYRRSPDAGDQYSRAIADFPALCRSGGRGEGLMPDAGREILLIDSHCHLDYLARDQDLDDVVARARAAGVGGMVTICTKVSEFDAIRTIAERYDDIWCSLGVHPHEAAAEPEVSPERLVELARHPRVVGIGESGLDYYYEHSSREAQQRSFRSHITAARTTGLPLIVHTRDADADTVDILQDEYAKGAFSGLIHCYSASHELAERSLEIGFLYLAFRDRDLQ